MLAARGSAFTHGTWHSWSVDSVLRGDCDYCGTVELAISDVRLVLARPDLDGDQRNLAQFRCPQCGVTCRQRLGERATRLVSAAGAQLVAAPAPVPDIATGGRGTPGTTPDRF